MTATEFLKNYERFTDSEGQDIFYSDTVILAMEEYNNFKSKIVQPIPAESCTYIKNSTKLFPNSPNA